jgi:peptidoglycan/xylan/chitin deacetylase (PgdA/CDA1 family)
MLAKLLHRTVALPGRLPGCRPLARRWRARSLALVMYHGVTAEPLPVFNWCQLDVDRFEEQVAFLAREYTLLPLSEVVRRLGRGLTLPDRAAVLTFDDGFRNVLTAAYPVLRRHQAPAAVFLVTGLVGTRQPPWPQRLYHAVAHSPHAAVRCGETELPLFTPGQRAEAYRALAERLKRQPVRQQTDELARLLEELGVPEVPAESPLATLDWDEVNELSRSGLVEFGSHTHTHPILSRCTREEASAELRVSRAILRERLGSADALAYPNGGRWEFTPETKALAAGAGYRCALSTLPGLNRAGADLYALRRVHVGADTMFRQFEMSMLGF